MANNQYVNKVIYGGQVIMDVSADTVEADTLLKGVTAHDKSGAQITGACEYDADTKDATASASEMLDSKTAYVGGAKVTGTMPNRGKQTSTIATKSQSVQIENGYHDGSGSVAISATEQAKIIASNIRNGVTILGVQGSMTGAESIQLESKSVTPYTTAKTYTPTSGKNGFSQFTVNAIAYSETDNAAGGKTVTIGTVAP